MTRISSTNINTPLGLMCACATSEGICLLEFTDRKNIGLQFENLHKHLGNDIVEEETPVLLQLKHELSEYYSGTRKEFTVPLHFIGTDFQKSIWAELLKIPYGKTVSYMQLSETIGNPKAIRAVANANANNKIAIIVPCHRVIGSDGSLTGYAGGLERKRWLLNLEGSRKELFC